MVALDLMSGDHQSDYDSSGGGHECVNQALAILPIVIKQTQMNAFTKWCANPSNKCQYLPLHHSVKWMETNSCCLTLDTSISRNTLRHLFQCLPKKSFLQPSLLAGPTPFLTTPALVEAPVCPSLAAPWVVGIYSCAAGHDRPMLGQASALQSTEQLIDSPHWGRWESSYVRQNAAGDEDTM